MLWIPSVQQKIKDIAVSELNRITNGQISIGNLSFRPFNKISLKDVYVPDLKGDTLLYVQNLSAGFSLSGLLHDELIIQSVKLENFTIGVSQDSTNAPYNFQFLIDAFASTDTTQSKPGSLKIEMDDISLNQGTLHYNIVSQKELPEGIDFNHIHVSDFNTRISLKSIDLEKLDIHLNALSLEEISGLSIKNLSGKITSKDKIINATGWNLQLPNSEIKIDSVTVNYTGTDIKDLMKSAQYSASIDIPQLFPADLQAFYLPLKNGKDVLKLNLKVTGKFPGINIENLQTSFGNFLSLDATGSIDDYINWDKSLFELNIKNLAANNKALEKIIHLTSVEPQANIQAGIRLEKVNMTAKLKGSLPNAKLDFLAKTSTGNLTINGTGGYLIPSNTSNFDLKIKSQNFNLKTLLNNASLGLVSLDLNANGKITGENIHAKAGIQLNRFDFNRYSYKNINVSATYNSDNIHLLATSKDQNIPFTLKANANTNPQKQSIDLYARFNRVRLDTLNLLKYKTTSLSLAVNTRIEGFDLERMNANVSIDSLFFATENGAIKQNAIKLNYQSTKDNLKSAKITSDIINANMNGKIILSKFGQTISNTLSTYLPSYFSYKKISRQPDSNFNLNVDINNMEKMAQALNIPFAIIDPANIAASYKESQQYADLNINIPKMKVNNTILTSTQLNLQTDTIKSRIHATAQTTQITETSDTILLKLNTFAGHDSIAFATNFESISSGLDIHGKLAFDAYLSEVKKQSLPNIFINILPTSFYFNRQAIHIESSKLAILEDRYTADHFKISLSENEFLTIDGTVSKNETDTLTVNFSRIQIPTIMQALRSDIDLKGEINGKFILTQLLSSPRLFTNNFTVKDITLSNNKIGDINLSSLWNNEYKGIGIQAALTQENRASSEITGVVIPERDSIRMKVNLNDIQLSWLTPFTQNYLYNPAGSIGAQINVTGKLSSPALFGNISIKDAQLGIKMTNTTYNISDNITISPNSFSMKDFQITDKNKNTMTVNGDITHSNFNTFKPDIKIRMKDFLLLNNPNAIDSLFYGNLRLNGSIDVTGSDKDLLVNMVLSNSGKGKVYVKNPDSEIRAQQFNSITFINPADTLLSKDEKEIVKAAEAIKTTSIPVKLKIALSIDPELTLGAVINPDTRDEANISGSGNIDFSYNMNNNDMSLLGQYTVDNGKCAMSLKNITKKTFNVQQGSEVVFNGDPMKTSFNITAVYPLRADLATLDQSFKDNSYLPTTKVNVNCLIKASGDMDKMDIQYDIVLPNASEELQQQVAGLIYSDDIKIREIAYLLALGSFWPPDSNADKATGNNLWTSLASSTLTSQLNNLLSGVLNENWTIGTDLHANDNSMSDLEMDVNISTHLFNDRLTVTGNVGYRNSPTSDTNFTGDFEVDYKLNKQGNIVLKMYNVTNDQYYEQAPTTQGVGIVYKKEAKTFRELFRKIKRTLYGE